MEAQFIDTQEVLWDNIDRFTELRNVDIRDIARAISQSPSNYRKTRDKRRNIGVRNIGFIAEVLGVQPLELLEVWTDQEWEEYVKWLK